MSQPKDFLGNELLSTFGMREFEVAVKEIVTWLASDIRMKPQPWLTGHDEGEGWEKKFRVNTFPGIDAGLFAMLCACGWIQAEFFPKYTFTLSPNAIKRLEASICQHPRATAHTGGDPFMACPDCQGYMMLRDNLWRHEGGVVQNLQPPKEDRSDWTTLGEMSFKITPSGLP